MFLWMCFIVPEDLDLAPCRSLSGFSCSSQNKSNAVSPFCAFVWAEENFDFCIVSRKETLRCEVLKVLLAPVKAETLPAHHCLASF